MTAVSPFVAAAPVNQHFHRSERRDQEQLQTKPRCFFIGANLPLSRLIMKGGAEQDQRFRSRSNSTPRQEDYQVVYNAIAHKILDDNKAPLLLRLGFHCSGTYDSKTGTGGSNGATMRFAPESKYAINTGMSIACDFLEPIKRP